MIEIKRKLLSLLCSGESVEKALTLFYFAKKDNSVFYDDYAVEIFYSHNLPKKSTLNTSHGTIGFYSKYLLEKEYVPKCSKEYLIANKEKIINYLVYNDKISGRAAMKFLSDSQLYWSFIKQLPFSYLYPEYIEQLIALAKTELKFFKLENVFLEKNTLKLAETIWNKVEFYKIFSLDYSGKIGTYTLNFKDDFDKFHILNELSKSSVLSGNSAVLIKLMSYRIAPTTIIGYREHRKQKRRSYTLGIEAICEGRETVIEPKIETFNNFYNDISLDILMEERNNIAFLRGYSAFLDFLSSKIIVDNKFDS